MSKKISRDIPNAGVIRTEASSWLAQLETGDLDHADVEALREWMRRSQKHTDELRRLAKLSGDLNVLAEMSGSLNDAADFHHPVTRRHSHPTFPGIAIVGCLVLAVLSIAWLFIPDGVEPQAFETAIGEYQEYRLSDGSIITLNTDSRVSVDYSEKLRKINLISGEALFTVAKNVRRPFIVEAGTHLVEAVGTAFLVRLDESQVEVSVTEGRVRLLDAPAPDAPAPDASVPTVAKIPAAPEPILLESGQSLKVALKSATRETSVPDILAVSEVEMQRKLAWREGLLDFHRTALSEVVTEVGRHTGIKIDFNDAELGAREFDGLFRVGETESLFEALKMRYGVRVTYLDTKRVLLSKKEFE